MKALVWHGKEDIRCDTVTDPEIRELMEFATGRLRMVKRIALPDVQAARAFTGLATPVLVTWQS